MTESEKILSYIDRPYDNLVLFLTRAGYKQVGVGQRDRQHNLNKVTFVSHGNSHCKVTVWHMWGDADQYGICKPTLVTDVDIRDLEPREDHVCIAR